MSAVAAVATKKRARLNAQGLARRDPGLMSCVLAETDHTTVSIDLASGEPTVVSHFSQDANYRYACFDGVGKAPFYRNGVLMLDDIYLMTASVSPIHKQIVADAFAAKWPAGSFADQWLADKEVVTKKHKPMRQFNKNGCLGFSYGMGPRKFVKTAYDSGYILSERDSKGFYKAYWALFSGVRSFADRLSRQVARDGYIINPFGYRGVPPEFKAFNFFIQSSVSGIMHIFTAKLMAAAPYAKYVTLIHDELIIDVPTHRLDEFKRDKERATDSLNADLNWSVNIRTGWAPGSTWYEAK